MRGSVLKQERDVNCDLRSREQLKRGLGKLFGIITICRIIHRTYPSEYEGYDEDEMRRKNHKEIFRRVPQNRTH